MALHPRCSRTTAAGLSDCFSNNLLPALLVVLGLVALVALAWYAWPIVLRLAAGPVLRAVLGTAGRSRIAAALGRGLGGRAAARATAQQAQRALQFSARQLQSKFKHAADFGVRGNYNPANAQTFQRAIEAHLRDAGTRVIQGTYRRQPVTHFYNPRMGLNVIRDARGHFQAGWRLSREQVENLLRNGALGGG